ncbi:invertase [Rathayibacter sp. AY1A3]|nr:invertase [Rathayibacter sp. AY1A3]
MIGYVRVSTKEQNLDLQREAMERAGITKVFEDQGVSGTLASRPGLEKALSAMDRGDVLVVWKLDRLGRSVKNVLDLLDNLDMEGKHFRSLTEGIDTGGPMGRAMLTIVAAFAQLERDQLVERTNAGLAVARAAGRTGGRPRKLDAKRVESARKLIDSGDSISHVAKTLGVSRPTLYRALQT